MTEMRSFLDLFRGSRERRPKVKSKLVPQAEGLESRNMPQTGGVGVLANGSGIFNNPQGVTAPITGVGTSTVQFGTPALLGGSPSSLSFTGSAFPTAIRVLRHNANNGVQVGQLTFANTQVTNPSLTGINLQVTIASDRGQRVA